MATAMMDGVAMTTSNGLFVSASVDLREASCHGGYGDHPVASRRDNEFKASRFHLRLGMIRRHPCARSLRDASILSARDDSALRRQFVENLAFGLDRKKQCDEAADQRNCRERREHVTD